MKEQNRRSTSQTAIFFLLVVMLATSCFASSCTMKKIDDKATVEKTLLIDEGDYEPALPLAIKRAELMSDGTVVIYNRGALAEKLGETYVAFDDCKEIFCPTYGNAGYRVLLGIKNDGTISAVSGKSLIEKKRFRLKNNLGDFKDVKTIEQHKDDSGSGIIVRFKDGSKKFLDEYLTF